MRGCTGEGPQSCGIARWGLAAAAAATTVMLCLSGCEGGGSDTPDGASIVRGNVETFSAGGLTYRPLGGRRDCDFLTVLSDALVPRAEAAVAGVMVHMVETDLTTMTEEDGSFVMTGVPAGHRRMEFTFNGATSTMELDVPEGATVTLGNVRCSSPRATADHMSTEMHGGSPAGGGMMGQRSTMR